MGRRLISDKVVSDDIVGTNGYHAPEVLFDESYDIRADIFMLGITFCVMVGYVVEMAIHEIIFHFADNWTWLSNDLFFKPNIIGQSTKQINKYLKHKQRKNVEWQR